MIDALHFEASMQVIPARGLVGLDCGALGNALVDEGFGLRFGLEHGRDRIVAAVPHDLRSNPGRR